MRELTLIEMEQVSGGLSDFQSAGIAVIGLGLAGGPVTAGFGLAIGGAMLYVGHYQNYKLK